MKNSTKQLLRFPFSAKDWLKRSGILFLGFTILIGVTVVSVPIVQSLKSIGMGVRLLYIGLFLLMMFIWKIYVKGYLLETSKNVMEEVQPALPRHTFLIRRLAYGVKGAFPSFILYVCLFNVFWVVFIAYLSAAYWNYSYPFFDKDIGTGVFLITIVFVFILFCLILILGSFTMFISPLIDYFYITKYSYFLPSFEKGKIIQCLNECRQ